MLRLVLSHRCLGDTEAESGVQEGKVLSHCLPACLQDSLPSRPVAPLFSQEKGRQEEFMGDWNSWRLIPQEGHCPELSMGLGCGVKIRVSTKARTSLDPTFSESHGGAQDCIHQGKLPRTFKTRLVMLF